MKQLMRVYFKLESCRTWNTAWFFLMSWTGSWHRGLWLGGVRLYWPIITLLFWNTKSNTKM